MVVERDGRRRLVRVCFTQQQQAAALAVADAHHIGAQQGGRSDVVGVGVRVHQVGDVAAFARLVDRFNESKNQPLPAWRRGPSRNLAL